MNGGAANGRHDLAINDKSHLYSVLERVRDGRLSPEEAAVELRAEGIRLRYLSRRYLTEAQKLASS